MTGADNLLEAVRAMLGNARERLASARKDARKDPTRHGEPGLAYMVALARAREAEDDIEALEHVEIMLLARQLRRGAWRDSQLGHEISAWVDEETENIKTAIKTESDAIAWCRERADVGGEEYAREKISALNIRRLALDDISLRLAKIADDVNTRIPSEVER